MSSCRPMSGPKRYERSVDNQGLVWSPSHTERWLLCPMKENLYRAGVPGHRERWSPGALVGTALHAGLARLALGTDKDPLMDEDAAMMATVDSIRNEWPNKWPDEGADEWSQAEVIDKALMCLRRVFRDMVPLLYADEGVVQGVEQVLGPGDADRGTYPGRADLVTEHGRFDDRYLCVTDWKTHWTLDDRYVDREQVTTEESWQLHQYGYFAQLFYGLPVRYLRKCVIRVNPPRSWLYSMKVNTNTLTRWHEQAIVVWDMMTNRAPWQNWGSCRRYGRCEYYSECH